MLLVYLVCRGVILIGSVPPWQGPDEPSHAAYAILAARSAGWPRASDAALEAAILDSMAAHRFYSHANAPAPVPPPRAFVDEPRFADAPTQLRDETPVGYAPFAAAAWAAGARASEVGAPEVVERWLAGMRWVSVGLVAVVAVLAYGAARSALGPRRGGAAAAVVAATPMLGFVGAVVNPDMVAVALATLWFGLLAAGIRRGLSSRWVAALVAAAAVAALAKRTGVFLAPLTLAVAIEHAARSWRARVEGSSVTSGGRSTGASAPRRRWTVGMLLALALATAFGFAAWPLHSRPAGWQRVGEAWGPIRSAHAARGGRYGLRVVDTSPRAWQYIEQWIDAPDGGPVVAHAWLRAAGAPGERAQIVLSDDAGTWAGETITLRRGWQAVSAELALAPAATRVRLAIVPGDGTAAGMAALDADDIRLAKRPSAPVVAAINGDAEAPRRLGRVVLAAAIRYVDTGRMLGSIPGGLADPTASARRAGTGLAFAWRSFWGGYGWLAMWPDTASTGLAALVTLFAAVAGLAAVAAPRRMAADEAEARILRWCAVATILAVALAVAGALAAAGPHRLPQGRYVLPALVAIALPAIALADRLWPRWGPFVLAAAMFVLDLAAVFGVIWPTFRTLD